MSLMFRETTVLIALIIHASNVSVKHLLSFQLLLKLLMFRGTIELIALIIEASNLRGTSEFIALIIAASYV